MRTRLKICILVSAALLLAVTSRSQELDRAASQSKHHRYKLIDLGTFGGPNTIVESAPVSQLLNERGMVVGGSESDVPDPFAPNCFAGPDCLEMHAFLWDGHKLIQLPEVPGGFNSFGTQINQFGWVAGASQDGTIDTTTDFPVQVPVVWRDQKPINLGTLGGAQGVANAVNDFGLAVGVSLTKTPDPFANDFSLNYLLAPATTSAHAFLWANGRIHDLGTLGGPDSVAMFVNDLGQVAGESYTSSQVTDSGGPALAPFLWQFGKMINIGLGGDFGSVGALNNRGQATGSSNFPSNPTMHPFFWDGHASRDLGALGGNFGVGLWLNEFGEVVGFATVAGDEVGHAFNWKNGKMTDLGVLNDDPCSVALGINNFRAEIVGASTDCGEGETAVLWENGQPPVDLNTLIAPGSGLFLHEADSINDQGEIAGIGLLPNGDSHIFLLKPEEGFVSIAELQAATIIEHAQNTAIRETLKSQTHRGKDLLKGVHARAASRVQSFKVTQPN